MTTTEPRRVEIPNWIRERAAGVDATADDQAEIAADLLEQRQAAWLSSCPKRFHGATLATVAPEVAPAARHWLEDPERANLLLLGETGTGKTWTALAVARELFFAGQSIAFRPVVEMFDALRPEGGEEVANLVRPDVLVLDDLGGERPTDWTGERLYSVVNRRWLECKPTIATTNLDPDDLRGAVGSRTYDRLRDGALAVHIGGESRRGHKTVS